MIELLPGTPLLPERPSDRRWRRREVHQELSVCSMLSIRRLLGRHPEVSLDAGDIHGIQKRPVEKKTMRAPALRVA